MRPVTEGVRFLGFVVYPTHRLLLRRKGVNYRRKLYRMVDDYPPRVGSRSSRWTTRCRGGSTMCATRRYVGPARAMFRRR